MNTEATYSGYIALIGRPNVGKSTLLNRILGKKLSITSRKPQTTRHRLLGIKTENQHQCIYVDTPGLHADAKRKLNKMMNRAAQFALSDVDIVLWVIDATRWTDEDDWVQALCAKANKPLIIVVNKIDCVGNKDLLLPLMERLEEQCHPISIIPISAEKGVSVDKLELRVTQLLPLGPFYFSPGDETDQSVPFILAEFLREKIFRNTAKELPYTTSVQIEKMELKGEVSHVYATIWVERDGQKAILLGTRGEKMKSLGRQARLDMERYLGRKVYLQIWIKVKAGWTENAIDLASLGYSE